MNAKAIVVLVAVGVVAAVGADRLSGQQVLAQGNGQARPALVEFLGADSKIQKQEFDRVVDEDSWLDLWCRHAGKVKSDLAWAGSYPKIDFSRCVVVAAFGGATVNSRGEELQSVDEVNGTLRLRFQSSSYQTASMSGIDRGEPAVPYGIWILPRTEKPMVIEQNVQHLIGQPPIWKEQATFEALKR